MSFELVEHPLPPPVIKVIGVGGGGGNAVEHMVASGVQGVEFVVANTDAQALGMLSAPTKLQLGTSLTKGLGAGANPSVGRAAALDDREKIEEVLKGTNMVFITAGMGGGTGTGAAPVFAEVAKDNDVLTVAVVTKPFGFENRAHIADPGIEELGRHVDSLIALPNDKLPTVVGKKALLVGAFAAANDVLRDAVQGIADIILRPGLINVDFADVCTVMSERGLAIMGTAEAEGEGRAGEAVDQAINSPLLDGVNLSGARGVVVNVTASSNMGITEFGELGQIVREFAADDATVVIGTVLDEDLGDRMRVTVVGTGIPATDTAANKPVLTPVHTRRAVGPPAGPARVGSRSQIGAQQPADESELDVAQSIRRQADGPEEGEDMAFLDIPSFLRRQAD